MERSVCKDRRRKVSTSGDDIIIIEDDEPSQPPVKRVTTPASRKDNAVGLSQEAGQQTAVGSATGGPEPVHSSPEVLELRQHLLMAKQAQLNAEQLVINTAQQLLNTESQLREAVLRAEQAEKEFGSKHGGRDEQRESELEAKVADLQKQLKREKKQSDERMADLTKQLEEERRKTRSREFQAKERIMELTHQLAYAKSQQTAAADDHNLLQLLEFGVRKSMSIDEGVKIVRAAFEKCGEKAKEILEKKKSIYDCEACDIDTPNKLAVITHFLTEEHIEKVRSLRVNISKLAVSNWKNMLDHTC